MTSRILILITAIGFSSLAGAQDWFYFETGLVSDTICPSSDTLHVFENWDMYQTLDNTWDGPRDTSICIGSINPWSIALSNTYDASRPVFVAYRGDSLLLNEDNLYALSFYSNELALDLDNLDFCNEGFCQGILVGVEIPAHPSDSLNTTDMRWYNGPFVENFQPEGDLFPLGNQNLCFPSEKFENGNVLRELVFKLLLDSTEVFHMDYVLLTSSNGAHNIPGSAEPYAYTQNPLQFFIEANSNEGPSGAMVLHTAEGYPSSDNLSYFDIAPSPNFDTIADLELVFSEGSSLVYQPFSELRGGLVEGSDSIRHNLSIINEGGEICFAGGLEVTINSNSFYKHRSGKLGFNGKGACMQFRPGARLILDEGADLEFGHGPTGILFMHSGSNIELGRYSSLAINNKLALGYHAESNGEDIHIYLEPFTSFKIGKTGRIIDWSDGQTRLVIHHRGGYLDISQLDSQSLSLVDVLYETPDVGADDLQILGSASQGFVNIGFRAFAAGSYDFEIIDIAGRTIQRGLVGEVNEGLQYKRLPIEQLNQGVYTLVLKGESRQLSAKFLAE